MKRFLIMLIALLLVLSTVVSCGPTGGNDSGNGSGSGTGDGPENPDNPDDPDDPDNPGTKEHTEGFLADPNGILIHGSAALGDVFLTQQKEIYPGKTSENAAFIAQFLPAEQVIAKGRSECPIYGVYGWTGEYTKFFTDWTDAGFTCYRANSDVNDTVMNAICASGINVMCTSGVGLSSYYSGASYAENDPDLTNAGKYNIQGWLEAASDKVYNLLLNYGPNGKFFSSYPDVNYNPIRAIEVCNEPNFQYMMPIKKVDKDGNITTNDAANSAVKTKLYCLLHLIEYYTIKNYWPDDPISGDPQVLLVGLGAGGETLDCAFIESALNQNNESKFGNDTLYDILNTAISNSSKLQTRTGYNGTTKKMDIDIAHAMDVLSTHHYINRGGTPFSYVGGVGDTTWSAAGDDKRIRSFMAAHGVDLPIWYTECGWEVTVAEGGLVKHTRGGTQLEQAMMEVMYYVYGLRNGIERITYMEMLDTDGCNYGQLNYISSGAGTATWRKCMYAIQNMTTLMPDPLLTKVVFEGMDFGKNYTSSGNDSAYIYEFESEVGGETVTVVFSPIKATTIRVPWAYGYALVTDLFGATKLVPAQNGCIVVDAGPALTYLRVPAFADLIAAGVTPTAATPIADAPLLAWVGEKNEY